jgi:Flp pilus assembly secretin CpaC
MMGNFRLWLGALLRRLIIVSLSLGGVLVFTIGRIEATEVITVEIGKALLVQLSATPKVVMLGNPNIADVAMEDNGLLFLLGKEPGETNLMILDDKGEVLISSPVIVAPGQKRHVTIDRGRERFTLSCNPRCVPVATPNGTGAATTTAAATIPASNQATVTRQPQASNNLDAVADSLNSLLAGQEQEK